ncbi:MAG: phage head closure protein [Rhodobacteraceae bacterium]|nr:phage head closure protein [Paracoccaceae bacterium]
MSEPHLNRKLVLETPERQPDGAGGFVEIWVPLGTLWADVAPRAGRELAGPGAAYARGQYKIIVRAAPPGAPSRPRPEQRFREDLRIFRIQAVSDNDYAGRFLTCFVDEEGAA